MANIITAIAGAVVGGIITQQFLSLREQWQDELIANAFHEEPKVTPVTNSIWDEETTSNVVKSAEPKGAEKELSQANVVDEMVRRQRERKAEIERNRAARGEVMEEASIPEDGESTGSYDPWTGVYRDGTFEVEMAEPLEAKHSEVPSDFEPNPVEKFYIKAFNKLVAEDRVIPFDPKWIDKEGNFFVDFDHRRHEKGFFAAITEDEKHSAVLFVSRKGVVAISLIDESKEIHWSSTRPDHPTSFKPEVSKEDLDYLYHTWVQQGYNVD